MDLEAFLGITPRYFAALQKKGYEKLVREQSMTEIMGAQMVAMVRACGFVQFKEPMAAKDFMPSEWRKQSEKPKSRSRSRQAIADQYRSIMNSLPNRS